jgi:hypothetical protein
MRELDHRRSGGIDVTLLWTPGRHDLLVCVSDDNTGDHFVINAPPSEARMAFHHPYAFAARHDHRVWGRIPALTRAADSQDRSC